MLKHKANPLVDIHQEKKSFQVLTEMLELKRKGIKSNSVMNTRALTSSDDYQIHQIDYVGSRIALNKPLPWHSD